jgi:chromosome segregation ATPase
MDNAIELTPERVNRMACDPGLRNVYQTIVKDVESRDITESEKEEMVLELLEQVIRDPAMFRFYEGIEKAEHDRISQLNGARRELNREIAEADRRVAKADWRAADADWDSAEADRGFAKKNWKIADEDRRFAQTDEEIADADRRLAEADREIADADRRLEKADREIADANRRIAEANREIAWNLKANGVPVEHIAKSTGLSEAQIREL